MSAKLLTSILICAGMTPLAVTAASIETVDATIPIEVLPVDPALATGGVPLQPTWSWPRIALQPARAAKAVVLEKNGDVLMLALLEPVATASDGKARIDGPPDRIAWCAPARLISNFMSCYQDLDSDGKFETSRTGLLGTNEVLSMSRMQMPKSIDPLAYRAARPEELPAFQVGYEACGTTRSEPHTFDGPLRFTTVAKRAEGSQWIKSGRCDNLAKLIETRPDGARLYEIGRFKVEVRQKDEKELATSLVEGIAPGTLLAHVRASWPLTDATERPKDADAIASSNSFLVAVGKPTIATQAKPGDEIFSLEVRHSLSGRLSAASEPRAKRDKLTLPEGTPVYGIAMRSSLTPWADGQVIWCTPVEQPKGVKPYCFAPQLSNAALVTTYSTPFTVRGIAPSGPVRNLPVVEAGPVDFGAPLILAVKVVSADKKSIHLNWSLAPRGQWYAEEWSFLHARDKTSLLLIGSLLISIKQSGDGQSFEITTRGEIDDGSPVDLPADAVRLMR
jgi:hypothetical protein